MKHGHGKTTKPQARGLLNKLSLEPSVLKRLPLAIVICLACGALRESPAQDAILALPEVAEGGLPWMAPAADDIGRLSEFRNERFDANRRGLENKFTGFPDFSGGLTVYGKDAAIKIGGYVKADLITDFDPIESTDAFDTGSILTDAPDRRNSRFHAKATRLSFDTRWKLSDEVARAFIEVDFFGESTSANAALRLRHAYGTLGNLTVGQTWTTFTDPSAVPQTLDFEGGVSNVNRRQGLVRVTMPLAIDGVSFAVGVENPRISLEIPAGLQGEARTETPDFITNLRFEQDWCEFQIAMVLRELGFQPVGQKVQTDTAWGFNFTGSVRALEDTKAYYQITFGEGIGSYRGSPDVVATSSTTAEVLPIFGWMIGVRHRWSDSLTSNLTFSELYADPILGQAPSNLRDTSYLAVNVIQNPYQNVFWGIEYLHGTRRDQSLARAAADRIQVSCGFFLP